jgi:hypothetical protein
LRLDDDLKWKIPVLGWEGRAVYQSMNAATSGAVHAWPKLRFVTKAETMMWAHMELSILTMDVQVLLKQNQELGNAIQLVRRSTLSLENSLNSDSRDAS